MYFKVTDKNMRSIYYDNYRGKGIQYEIGKMVKPAVGKIFAYSLSHLAWFGFQEFKYDIFRQAQIDKRLFICQCFFPKHVTVFVRRPMFLAEKDIGEVERRVREIDTFSHVERRIVLASGVKLIREVLEDEFHELISKRYELLKEWREQQKKKRKDGSRYADDQKILSRRRTVY